MPHRHPQKSITTKVGVCTGWGFLICAQHSTALGCMSHRTVPKLAGHVPLPAEPIQAPTPVDLSPLPDLGLGFREKTGSFFFSLYPPCHQVEGSFQEKPCPSVSPTLSGHGHSANCQENSEATHSKLRDP